MSSCPDCGSIQSRIKTSLGYLPACLGCDLVLVEGLSGFDVGGVGVHFHAYAGERARACSYCRQRMLQRSLVTSQGTFTGEHCEPCDRFQASLGSVSIRSSNPRQEPESEWVPRESRQGVEIEERDRIFAFLFAVPLELSEGIDPRPKGVSSLVLLCVGLFVLTMFNPQLFEWLALPTAGLSLRTPIQLLTSIFMHAGLVHLLGNLYFLYCFGRLPEAKLGTAGLLALFIWCGLVGGVTHLALYYGGETYLVGASGAISGLLGYYFVTFPNHRLGVSWFFGVLRVPAVLWLGLWFYLQVLSLAGQDDLVAYSAHVGGFVAGVLYRLVSKRFASRSCSTARPSERPHPFRRPA